jgi:benzoate/toluate 1,2-dioxygenase alpha subunit
VSVAEPDGYTENFPKEIGGLVHVPRLGVYRGLIFASLSAEGESLEDYLGEIKDYVDLWVERSPLGVVRLLPPHKTAYPGNWKFQSEQDTDGYHGRYVHDSAFKTLEHFHGAESLKKDRQMAVHGIGRTRGFSRGHCLLERPGTRAEMPAELIKDYLDRLTERYGAERAERIAMVRHVLIYPNVYLMDDHLRVHYPVSVDRTVVHSHFNHLEGAPEEVNKHRLKNVQWRHGQAGFVGTDDVEMFIACQSGMQATGMGRIVLSRGLHREVRQPSGERMGHSSDETPQRVMYREWLRLMSGEAS